MPTFPAASEVVDAPAHARVLIDVDGRFSDIPDSDWRGEDAFTDVLGDGSARSNVATAQGLTGRRGQHQQIDVPG